MNFQKIDEYRLSGTNHNVLVRHWATKGYSEYLIQPEHHWCLYVVIGKNHSKWKDACQYESDDYDGGDEIYPDWHGGCTFYSNQEDYVKIGCDYNHLGDDEFMYADTDEMPETVREDAEKLYNYFKE